jgi:hypothetical protein
MHAFTHIHTCVYVLTSTCDKLLQEEEQQMLQQFELDKAKRQAKQEREFIELVQDGTKRAIGRSKSCSCTRKYLCTHNKTAS